MRKKLYEKTITRLSELVNEWGKSKVYLVGGCVRDSIIGFGINDIDIMVDLQDGPKIFCDWLKQEKKAKNFVVYPRFVGTARFDITVGGEDVQVECVMPRGSSGLIGDAERRDFCCNALYQDIETLEIIDPTKHGMEDIKNKILRTPIPAAQTFRDDPLRMLRAFRFWAEKDFKIHPDVFTELKPYPEYMTLSMERINSEFCKILKSKKAAEIIRELHRTCLLGYILPEFEEGWGFNQNSHYHSMNLTDHSLCVLSNTKKNDLRLRMAALLHDISKYKKWVVKNNGEFGYPGHEIDSAKMSVSILQRLKWSGEDIKIVQKIISKHMILKPFRDSMTGLYNGSRKITNRIVRELGDEIELCLDLINADNLSHAPLYNMPSQVSSFYNHIHTKIQVVRSCPVSGSIIMEKFGLKPGPIIKEVKEIMLGWLDENPNLSGDQLVQKFGETYGGKVVWVWNSGEPGILCVTLLEPVRIGGRITTQPYEFPYNLEGKIDGEDWEMWKAIEHPKLYSAVIRSKKARDIFKEAATKLSELEKIVGFKTVKMELDSYNDLSGIIEWEDLKPDYIW